MVPQACWRRIRLEYEEVLSETDDDADGKSGRRVDLRQIRALVEATGANGKLQKIWTSFGSASQSARCYLEDEGGAILQFQGRSLEDWKHISPTAVTTQALLIMPGAAEISNCFQVLNDVQIPWAVLVPATAVTRKYFPCDKQIQIVALQTSIGEDHTRRHQRLRYIWVCRGISQLPQNQSLIKLRLTDDAIDKDDVLQVMMAQLALDENTLPADYYSYLEEFTKFHSCTVSIMDEKEGDDSSEENFNDPDKTITDSEDDGADINLSSEDIDASHILGDDRRHVTEPAAKILQNEQALRLLQDNDPDLGIVIAVLKGNAPQRPLSTAKRLTYASTYELRNGLLHRKNLKALQNGQVSQPLLCIPRVLRRRMMYLFHSTKLASHLGSNKTFENIRRKYWWKGMERHIQAYVKGCLPCQLAKSTVPHKHGKLHYRQPNTPFGIVSIDLFGHILHKGRKKWVVTMVDLFTRWVEVAFITKKSSTNTANAFLHTWILKHEPPVSIVSDRGSEFKGFFTALNAQLGIKKVCVFITLN